MMTDTVADMLTRIRNGLAAKHRKVIVPASGLKKEIARILREEGFVDDFVLHDTSKGGEIEVVLKYADKDRQMPVISGLQRVSRPGCRVYCGRDEVPVVLNGLGVAIVSTSKGLLTDRQCREVGVGGEVICKVW